MSELFNKIKMLKNSIEKESQKLTEALKSCLISMGCQTNLDKLSSISMIDITQNVPTLSLAGDLLEKDISVLEKTLVDIDKNLKHVQASIEGALEAIDQAAKKIVYPALQTAISQIIALQKALEDE